MDHINTILCAKQHVSLAVHLVIVSEDLIQPLIREVQKRIAVEITNKWAASSQTNMGIRREEG